MTTLATTVSPLDLPVPEAPARTLAALVAQLQYAAGDQLVGVVLYGGAARGRYREGRSDLNVAICLREATTEILGRLAPSLQTAFRAARVEPLILTAAEVQAAANAFPIKFLDIQRHHIVLAGKNPFHDLAVDDDQVRLRVEQELRNFALRLRRQYLAAWQEPVRLAALLAQIARPLAILLAELLRLAGRAIPENDRTAAVFSAAAEAFGLDGPALAQLDSLRHQSIEPPTADDAAALLDRVLKTIDVAIRVVDSLRTGAA